ncbi:hypothetical protein HYDPIDRAFT_100793 [Hydnomerulius pinastri MD-312]|uniref:Protein kinase domain-containing protein n=1 Tax=Hydnomerulius pinastri MD-312 TaxID=994086 RepID=A0A0C9V2C4_9AGAM|nr:hypothetical protein HYDPIDRAFT_100793 [Hydnomerulius pinastri MD-312]
MASTTDTPPRAPPIKYTAHLGTRWQKEKAAAGIGAFEFPEDPKYIGQWIIGECVGKGASGRVRIAKHRRTGQLAAVKILPLQPLMNSRASLATHLAKSEKQRLGIDREIIMMKLMNHPNILRIYDVFEGENELYLVLEYVEGGELFDFLVNRGRLPPLEALAFFKQIVYGLNYAHTFSIIHRDLKPENILIHSLNPPLVKLADWGMAAFAPPALQLETSCGSPHYASPEIVNGMKYKGTATDIWSCGVILYALLTGRLPFDDKNVRTLLAKVKTGRYDVPAYIDPVAKDLLTRMLVVDVNRRITIPEILSHPWLSKLTPGIIYVPAPSVTELARPLASEAHIDEDLLESLRVIWGKHADTEAIKTDLLSPQGEGTLAKAFFFLLHQYREQTLKDYGIILDVEESQLTMGFKVVTKQYRSPSQRRPNRLEAGEIPTRHGRLHTDRDAPPPPSRTPSPNPSGMGPPSPTSISRSRTPSPVGPRPPKPRPASSLVSAEMPTRHKSMTIKPVVLSPPHAHVELARARSSTATMLSPRIHQDAHNYHAHNQQMYQPMHIPGTPPTTSNVRAIPASPRPGDYDMMMDVETNIADRVNVLLTRGNTAQGQDTRSPIQVHQDTLPPFDQTKYAQGTARHTSAPTTDDFYRQGRGQENKENGDQYEGKYSYLENDPMQISGGLFAKPHGGRVGRELRNSLHGVEFLKRDNMKEKERNSKAPDLHPAALSPRRSGMSSPHQLSSPAMPSILSSPVGEFKGWFSNLFNWKAHTYVLCSTNHLTATRTETIRILEQFGVSLGIEETDGQGTLRCRMNDLVDSNNGALIQKHVRFRVEFSSNSPQARGLLSPPLGAGASASPVSPSLASARYALSRQTMAGCTCAIVLVQEKGSVSTFRALCRWLREEWTLDALVSPPPTGGQGSFLEQQQRHAML